MKKINQRDWSSSFTGFTREKERKEKEKVSKASFRKVKITIHLRCYNNKFQTKKTLVFLHRWSIAQTLMLASQHYPAITLYELLPISYDTKLLSQQVLPCRYNYFQWGNFIFWGQDRYWKTKNILLPSHTACGLNRIMKQAKSLSYPCLKPLIYRKKTKNKPAEVTLQCVQQRIFRCWWKEHIFLGHQISCAADNGQ